MERHTIDLSQGTIWKQIARFALPLLVGNLFQQLYNTVDTIVVGRYVGKVQLAAVGSMGNAINALIGFFMGLATGASVIISQYRGAHNDKRLSDSVQTTVALSLIACVFCTIAGNLAIPLLLKMLKIHPGDDVYPYAVDYLRIYFTGICGMLIYNIGAGILRAVGDSKRPLYFLCVSALLNVGLDLLFVMGFKMEVKGVAYATVISQAVSACLVLIVLTRSHTPYAIKWKKLAIDRQILSGILKIGLPTAVQSAITSISNVFVQGYINAFKADCMAGWTAYGRIDQFALLPVSSLALSSTTFVGQNLGAGNMERAKKGCNVALLMCAVICVVMAIPMMLFAPNLIGIFNSDPEVLRYGSIFLRMMSPFYTLCALNQIYAGVLRGAGVSTPPTVIMLASFVAFRQLYLFVCSRLFDSFRVVALAYPMGWILCSILMLIYYYRADWESKSTVLSREKQRA
ncbi:MAG: MATE family efflux transporter [Clostridia bacterium]|nr:MATE family efflux transporter [Clostridia bacterium]